MGYGYYAILLLEGPFNCLGDGLVTVFTKPILRATELLMAVRM